MLTRHNPYDLMMEELNYINCIDNELQDQVLNGSKDSVINLRKAYNNGRPDYSNETLRAAYMLAYYPHYIQPVCETLHKLPSEAFQAFNNMPKVQACFFGAGPAPEVLGWLAAIKEILPKATHTLAHLLDKYHWSVGQLITRELVPTYWRRDGFFRYFPREVDMTDDYDSWSISTRRAIGSSQMLIMQNCLNDEIGTSDIILDNMAQILHTSQEDTLLIIIDLMYPDAKQRMKEIEHMVEGTPSIIYLSVDDGVQELETGVETPDYIKANLLLNEDGLRPRKWVKHFATAIQIKHPKLDDIPF